MTSVEDFQAGFRAIAEGRGRGLNALAGISPEGDPQRLSDARRMADTLGTPLSLVESDPDRAQALIDQRDRDRFARDNPVTAEWFALDPQRLRIADDDRDNLGGVGRAVRAVADYGRSAAAGAVGDVFGRGVEAYGDFLARLDARRQRQIEENIARLEAIDATRPGSTLADQARRYYSALEAQNEQRLGLLDDAVAETGEVMRDVGGGFRNVGEAIAPPEERQSVGTAIAGGVGQVVGQVALFMVGGGTAGMAGLFGQGMSVQAEQLEQANVDLDSPEAMAAIGAGGVITAATERVGLAQLFRQIPGPQRRVLLGRLWRIFRSGGEEALQESLEAIAQNAVTVAAADSEVTAQAIFGGVAEEAGVAGGVGAVVRTAVEFLLPGRHRQVIADRVGVSREGAEQQAQAIRDLATASQSSALSERAPDLAEDHAAEVLRAADGNDAIYVDGSALREFFQSAPEDSPDAFADSWGIDAEGLSIAFDMNDPVAIPVERFVRNAAADPAVTEWFAENGRFDPEGLSLADARRLEDDIEALHRQIEEQQPTLERSVREQIAAELRTLAQDAGVSIEEAAPVADLWASIATTLADRAGVDAAALWERIRPQIMGPDLAEVLPDIDALNVMLARLRAGETADPRVLGQSLGETIRSQGGVIDDGGEVAALEPDESRPAFQRRMIREPGGSTDQQALPGQERTPSADADFTFERVFERMVDAGFFPELTGQDVRSLDARQILLHAIAEDLSGRPRYAYDPAAQAAFDRGAEVDRFREHLARLGLDESATDAEIRTAVEADMREAADRSITEDSRTYDQALGLRWVRGQIRRLIARARRPGNDPRARVTIGGVSDWLVEAVAEQGGPDLTGYSHMIDLSAVRHIERKHGDEGAERSRGQLPVRDEDIEAIPDILASPDFVATGVVGKRGQDVLAFLKRADDGSLLLLEERRSGRRQLAALSLRRYPAATNAASILAPSSLNARSDDGDNVSVTRVPEGTSALAEDQLFEQRGEPLFDRRGAVRGSFELPAGGLGSGPSLIRLYESRDLSTLLHESGHFWLEALRTIAEAPEATPEVQGMWRSVLDWMQVESGDQIGTPQHELWARTFEAYLMEGKAPSVELSTVFERFRAWLVYIYRTVAGLRANLTPEIRDVMDRMVASDEEIAAARQRAGAEALFDPGTAVSQGLMTEAEAEAYGRVVERAAADAQAQMLNRMQRFIRKQQTEDYRREAETVRRQVEAEVNGRPVYRALEWLANGRWIGEGEAPAEPVRLSRAVLDAEFPGFASLLPGPARLGRQERNPRIRSRLVWTNEGGAHPDTVGLLFGYARGEDMLQDLVNVQQTRRDAIDAEVDRIMRERVGDPATDGTAAREALDAIHSDQYGHQLQMELAALSKGVTPEDEMQSAAAGRRSRVTTRQMAREAARRMISRMRVSQAAKPGRFLSAERKAGRDAAGALANGDMVEAARQKQHQLLQHALYMEARKVETEVQRGLDMVKDVRRTRTRQRLGQNYVDRIDEILEGYQFKPRSQRRMRSMRGLLEFVGQMEEAGRGDELAIPPEVMAEAERDRDHPHYTTLSVEQLRGVLAAVENIRHLGLTKNRLQVKRERAELDAVAGEIADQIRTVGPRSSQPFASRTAGDRAAGGLRDFLSSVLKVETILRHLDGFQELGPAYRHIKSRIDAAGSELLVRQDTASAGLERLFSAYSRADQRRMDRKTLRVVFGGEERAMSKWDVVAIALNWGNDYNRDAVLEGERATEAEVWAIFDQHMTDADWRFVQAAWDYLETFWPEIAALQRRTTGLDPVKVETAAVVRPTTGQQLAAGGYYPVAFDPGRSIRAAEERQAGEMVGMLPGKRAAAQTRQGHTVERQGTGGRAVLLDVAVLQQHVQGVVYDLAMREAVTAADKVLKHRAVRHALSETGNGHHYRTLELWLKDVAGGEQAPREAAGRLVRRLRTGYTVARLGFNLKTAALQLTGLAQTSVAIGHKWTMLGMNDALQPSKWQFAHATSTILARRGETFHRDIFDTLRGFRQGRASGFLQKAAAASFVPMAKLQLVVDTATWLAAYRRGMSEFRGDEAQAIEFADRAIVRAQGSGVFADRTAWERGTLSAGSTQSEWVKGLTMFYSYFASKLSVAYERTQVTDFRNPASVLQWATDMVVLFMVEGMLIGLAENAFFDDEDEEGSAWLGILGDAGTEGLNTLLATVPVIREFASATQGFSGGGSVGAIGGEVARLWRQLEQGEADVALLKSVVSFSGTAFAIPGASQVNRMIDYAMSDEEIPPTALIFGVPR